MPNHRVADKPNYSSPPETRGAKWKESTQSFSVVCQVLRQLPVFFQNARCETIANMFLKAYSEENVVQIIMKNILHSADCSAL